MANRAYVAYAAGFLAVVALGVVGYLLNNVWLYVASANLLGPGIIAVVMQRRASLLADVYATGYRHGRRDSSRWLLDLTVTGEETSNSGDR